METNATKKVLKSLAVAGLSQVPIVSAFATFVEEYANLSWQERIETAQKIILDKVAQQGKQFEQRSRDRSNFASVLGNAYQSALTDVDENKVPLYANAFINAINREALENTKVHIFLNLLRDFSILHIKVLRYFSTTHKETYYIQQHMNTFRMRSQEDVILDIIRQAAPDIAEDEYLLNTVMNDLYTKRVLQVPSLFELHKVGMSIDKTINKMTTKLGDEFLNFIEDNAK